MSTRISGYCSKVEPHWVQNRTISKLKSVSTQETDKEFFHSLAAKLQYETMEDWYKLSRELICKHGGELLLSNYNNSPTQALKSLFPDYGWKEWKFHYAPNGFWNDKENQLKFTNWLGEQLEFKSMEDWYNISQDLIIKYDGNGFLETFQGSPYLMLKTLYPHYEWLPWKFHRAPNNYWKDPIHHKKFLDWLGEYLGFKSMEDWYQITQDTILDNGGCGMLGMYNDSPYHMLQSVYPNHEWLPWKFTHTPLGFWMDTNNQRMFIEWLAKQLQLKSMNEWSTITNDQMQKYGGFRVLSYYNGSILKMLQTLYPHQDFCMDGTPRRVLDSIAKQLKIKSMEDWYKVSKEQIYKHGGHGILEKYDSLIHMLQQVYPEYEWLPWKFINSPNGFWMNSIHQRNFIDWLGKQVDT